MDPALRELLTEQVVLTPRAPPVSGGFGQHTRGAPSPVAARIRGGTKRITGKGGEEVVAAHEILIDGATPPLPAANWVQMLTLTGGSAVAPSDFAGLVGHWKADALSVVDGAPVASWPDASSEHNDLAQTDGPSRPIFKAHQVNGLPALLFAGGELVSMGLTRAPASAAVDGVQAARSFFALVCFTANPVPGANALVLNLEWADGFLRYGRTASFGFQLQENGPSGMHFVNTDLALAEWHLLEVIHDPATGTSSLKVDGTPVGTPVVSGPAGVAGGGAQLALGEYVGGYWSMTGYIAEQVLYNVALAAGDQQKLERYFSLRYGMTLPGADTYQLSFAGQTTAAIAQTASAAELQAVLEALSSIGAGNVTVSGVAGGPYTITLSGPLTAAAQPLLVASAGTHGLAGAVAGVNPDGTPRPPRPEDLATMPDGTTWEIGAVNPASDETGQCVSYRLSTRPQ